ncbi:hypothetical protein GCM10023340_15930 [Nocardioides marinquilinus]|uniref:Outer membrane channel protein CpnT-like N-terminal domain-containing protein n=1 Tax=Nocardioides marinquilinus TaxID=1210400 RepID=A0ABP9PFP5_9ACTN
MSHVDVDGVGYREASGVLAAANRAGAGYAAALGDGLAGTGAMAGDSSFASHFSPAYDEAAGAVVSAVDVAVEALGSLAALSWHSIENHRRADAASVLGGADGSTLEPPAALALAAAPDTPPPPPSEGGDPSSLPGWANAILDHLEGFLWPDADVDRLRAAATTWRTAGDHVDDLNDRLLESSNHLWRERSPEVPLALEVLEGLGRSLFDIACACRELATACDDYADAVEAQREAILELVRDLIRDAILIATAGFIIGFVTGGGSNAVAAYINSGKLAAETPKFIAILDTLRAAAAVSCAGLGKTTTNVWAVSVDVAHLARATPVVSAATHAPAVVPRIGGAERIYGVSTVRDAGAVARMRRIIGDPRRLDPHSLQGMDRRDLEDLMSHWKSRPSSDGVGIVYEDPVLRGRQIRVMEGYPPGSRPDPITLGDYVQVSQNGDKTKVALKGNPTL